MLWDVCCWYHRVQKGDHFIIALHYMPHCMVHCMLYLNKPTSVGECAYWDVVIRCPIWLLFYINPGGLCPELPKSIMQAGNLFRVMIPGITPEMGKTSFSAAPSGKYSKYCYPCLHSLYSFLSLSFHLTFFGLVCYCFISVREFVKC